METDVEDFTPDELIDFLKEDRKVIDDSVAEILRHEKVNGRMFLHYFDQDDFQELGVPRAVSMVLFKLKKKMLNQQNSKDECTAEAGSVSQSGSFNYPRPFLEPVDGQTKYQYRQGCALSIHETGSSSLLEPSREFKQIKSENFRSIEDLAANFATKVIKFAIACLNSRCNGTFYAGVLDHPHGKVLGIPLDEGGKAVLQETMDSAFTGPSGSKIPGYSQEMRDAVRGCCKPLRFVPIIQGGHAQGTRFVVELDIQSSIQLCKGLQFFLSTNKRGQPCTRRQYVFREGAHCQTYTEEDEVRRKCETADALRESQEAQSQTEMQSRHKKLMKMLSGGWSSGFPNQNCMYVLLTNGIGDVQDFTWIPDVNFYSIIDLGLGESVGASNGETGEGDTLLFEVISEGQIREVSLIGQDRLCKMETVGSDDAKDFLASHSVGEKILYIQGGGKVQLTNGSVWQQQVGKGIKKLIRLLFDASHHGDLEKVVVITLVPTKFRLLELVDILKEIAQVLVTYQQFVLLFPSVHPEVGISVTQELDKDLLYGSSWRDQCLDFNWTHLNDFLCSHTKTKSSSDLKIPASDTPVNIPSDILEYYEEYGLHVWPFNQIQLVKDMTKSAEERHSFIEKRKVQVREFLQGKTPQWEIFFFSESASGSPLPFATEIPPGLVERETTDDIISELKDLAKIERKGIAKLEVAHWPGAGATTIGRHVLWKMRETWRCAHIDGREFVNGVEVDRTKVDRMAETILRFRKFQESDATSKESSNGRTCPIVLILFDNTSAKLLNFLLRRLEFKCQEQGIMHSNVMVLLLGLISSFSKEIDTFEGDEENADYMYMQQSVARGSSPKQGKGKRYRLNIAQELSQKEKELFKARLDQIHKDWYQDLQPESMISFVIMAENFNDDSEYVQNLVRTVLNTLSDKMQRKTLLFLAVLKYFGDSNLPEKHCKMLAFSQYHESLQEQTRGGRGIKCLSMAPARQLFPPQMSIFIDYERRKRCVTWENSFWGSYVGVEVVHMPVANHLWRELRQCPLSNVVIDLISNEILLNESFMKAFVQYTFRTLLTKRIHADKSRPGYKAPKFSRLIEQIVKDEGRTSATELLKFAFKTLSNDKDKAYIAQALSRLQYDYFVTVEEDEHANAVLQRIREGQEWAKTATELSGTNFALRDTYGQSFKSELRFQLNSIGKKRGPAFLRDWPEIVRAGKLASDNFKEAQKLFNNMKAVPKHDTVESPSTSNHGLQGQIDVNLQITKFILDSEELKEPVKRDGFLRFLLKDNDPGGGLYVLFPDIDWACEPWSEYRSYIEDLFTSTSTCLSKATRKLGYVNSNDASQQKSMKVLEKKLSGFSHLFNGRPPRWMSVMALEEPHRKQNYLRNLLAIGLANNFTSLIFCKDLNDLLTYQDYLNKMVALGERSMVSEDKMSYMNVSFALHRAGGRHVNTNLDVLRSFCQELVQSGVSYPEAYMFYLMLFWPTTVSSSGSGDIYEVTSREHLELLRSSIIKLEEAEREYLEGEELCYHRESRAKPIFFLGKGNSRRDLSAFLPRRKSTPFPNDDQMLWLTGALDEKKNVAVKLRVAEESLRSDGGNSGCGGGDIYQLMVRSASLHYRGKPHISKVRFQLGFAMSGPTAYHSAARETDEEDRKITQRMAATAAANNDSKTATRHSRSNEISR